jgi:hypothetical protein
MLKGRGSSGAASAVFSGDTFRYSAGSLDDSFGKLNHPRGGLSLAAVSGDVYAFGGTNGKIISQYVEKLDGSDWTDVADMLTPRAYPMTVVVGGKVYVVGGLVYNPLTSELQVSRSIEVFDPSDGSKGSWRTLSNMPGRLRRRPWRRRPRRREHLRPERHPHGRHQYPRPDLQRPHPLLRHLRGRVDDLGRDDGRTASAVPPRGSVPRHRRLGGQRSSVASPEATTVNAAVPTTLYEVDLSGGTADLAATSLVRVRRHVLDLPPPLQGRVGRWSGRPLTRWADRRSGSRARTTSSRSTSRLLRRR